MEERISRRDFLKYTALLIAGAAIGTLVTRLGGKISETTVTNTSTPYRKKNVTTTTPTATRKKQSVYERIFISYIAKEIIYDENNNPVFFGVRDGGNEIRIVVHYPEKEVHDRIKHMLYEMEPLGARLVLLAREVEPYGKCMTLKFVSRGKTYRILVDDIMRGTEYFILITGDMYCRPTGECENIEIYNSKLDKLLIQYDDTYDTKYSSKDEEEKFMKAYKACNP